MKKLILAGFLLTLFLNSSIAQISITSSSFTYLESFSSEPAAVPVGWSFFETGSNANSAFVPGTGSSNTGDTYMFGALASSEYAFGGLLSGSLVPNVGVCFTNNTGEHIVSLAVSFTGETWRVGATGRSDRMDCQINTNTTGITGSGTWTDVNNLDYTNNPSAATGSGSMLQSTNVSYTITGLAIPDGTTFCLRWLDFNASGSDDGLGIDDFQITSLVLPIELASFTATNNATSTLLSFYTESERDNDFFAIERSVDGRSFVEIGQVKGAGTSRDIQHYTFTDEHPVAGKNYYRLRQVDFDGKYAYSSVVSVTFAQAGDITIAPSPATDRVLIQLDTPATEDGTWQVFDAAGRLVQSGVWMAESDAHTIQVGTLPEGMYAFRLAVGQTTVVKQFRKQ